MQQRTVHDLGFDLVMQEVRSLCLSEEGREAIIHQGLLFDAETLSERQDFVEDLMSLSAFRDEQPVTFPHIQTIMDELRIPGRSLDGQQLYALSDYLHAAKQFTRYCRDPRRMPSESSTSQDSVIHPAQRLLLPFDAELDALLATFIKTLDSPGEVKPSHPAIAKLVKEVDRRRAERQRYSQDFLRQQPGEAVNIQPVFRDGRVVLPVRSDQRSATEGIVHSSSSSGATVFLEPYRLVELNNQVVMAQQQIQIEIARILAELSEQARQVRSLIAQLMEHIAFADSMYARSRYAEKFQCTRPILSTDGTLNLIQARHPLLRNTAVPISLALDDRTKAVVISGPNAGGKTVTIKTVGLFAMLHQSLYLLPAAEGTRFPLYRAVYTDIGDDQSIEEALSTFSGHMKNIGNILKECDQNSLVILDELGSGTDPVEGSALARAIMEYCVEHASLTLVTSHHSVLKQYAYAHAQVLNASMEFDSDTHEPTFKVIAGLPGESHALDTARRMALPEEVIGKAEGYVGSEMIEISTIIRELEERRREAEVREKAIADRSRQVQEQVRRLDLRALKLKQDEQLLRREQIGDLSRFIADKRGELENLVAELREGEITREKTKRVKAFISSMEQKKVESESRAQSIEKSFADAEPRDRIEFAVGMDVLAGPKKREGRIVRKERQGKWLVAIGPMKFPMEEKDLYPIPERKRREQKRVSVSYESRSVAPKPLLDVRGKTLDEALEAVAVQIEGALVHSLQEFSIIHGMGDGILSRGIHEYLGTSPQVSHYYFARPEDGGYGKTYVEL